MSFGSLLEERDEVYEGRFLGLRIPPLLRIPVYHCCVAMVTSEVVGLPRKPNRNQSKEKSSNISENLLVDPVSIL